MEITFLVSIEKFILAYADDVNLLGDKIDTMKNNTETLIEAREEISLEVDVEKATYMLLSLHQNVAVKIGT
jgi:hypothetical protein